MFACCFVLMTTDLQMVQISLRVLFRPDSLQLQDIYRKLGQGMQQNKLVTFRRRRAFVITLFVVLFVGFPPQTSMSESCHPLSTKSPRLSLLNTTLLSC